MGKADLVTIRGTVIRKRVFAGTKSERVAVCASWAGKAVPLRRLEHPSLEDPVLDGLVGHQVEATGEMCSSVLIVHRLLDLGTASGS